MKIIVSCSPTNIATSLHTQVSAHMCCVDILLVRAGLSLSSTVLRFFFSNLAYDCCLKFRYAGLAQRLN